MLVEEPASIAKKMCFARSVHNASKPVDTTPRARFRARILPCFFCGYWLVTLHVTSATQPIDVLIPPLVSRLISSRTGRVSTGDALESSSSRASIVRPHAPQLQRKDESELIQLGGNPLASGVLVGLERRVGPVALSLGMLSAASEAARFGGGKNDC